VHDVKHEEGILTKSEAKLIKRDLINHLKKKNPKYEDAVNLIGKGHDIFSNKDKALFEKELELTGRDFDNFKMYFFKDLKHAFDQIGVHHPEEGMAVLKTAKIAQNILAKLIEAASAYYLDKEPDGQHVVCSKAGKNGPRQDDDFVEFRGTEAAAKKKLQSLQNSEE